MGGGELPGLISVFSDSYLGPRYTKTIDKDFGEQRQSQELLFGKSS